MQVLKILKENEISLGDIQQGKKIIDLIKDKENKEEILERLQNISEEINEKWPIGVRLNNQKANNLTQLEAELKKAGLDLTDEEKKKILVKINSKGKIKDTVKQNKGNLYETIKAGEELEAEILMVEKTSERSASDVRGQ